MRGRKTGALACATAAAEVREGTTASAHQLRLHRAQMLHVLALFVRVALRPAAPRHVKRVVAAGVQRDQQVLRGKRGPGARSVGRDAAARRCCASLPTLARATLPTPARPPSEISGDAPRSSLGMRRPAAPRASPPRSQSSRALQRGGEKKGERKRSCKGGSRFFFAMEDGGAKCVGTPLGSLALMAAPRRCSIVHALVQETWRKRRARRRASRRAARSAELTPPALFKQLVRPALGRPCGPRLAQALH